MDIELWLKGVAELNCSFDDLISQRNEILGAMQIHIQELFIKYMDIAPMVKLPLCHMDGKVRYGDEIIVEIPINYDEDLIPQRFNNHLFELIGWDFTMNKIPSEKHGWVIELTFYPFGGEES